MPKLNSAELHARLLEKDKHLQLVEYIFSTQGATLQRLNYRTAGAALGVSKNTIGVYVAELAAKNVINIEDGQIRINQDILLQPAN
ncbi:MAG: hypothetical protein J6B04_05455 [Clostridia bacterium]|nr:hypothetical protein [Clostridia bacterium]